MKRSISRVLLVFALVAALPGCDESETKTITHSRKATKPSRPVKLDATSAERFDMGRHAMGAGGGDEAHGPGDGHDHGDPKDAGQPKVLDWTVPPGWVENPRNPQRQGGFTVAGNPEADCSITILGGEGGGTVQNVNRWLSQFDQAPLSPEAVARLPKRPVLGTQGIVVEAAGAFKGMGGGAGKPGFKLLGLMAQISVVGHPVTCFVKLVGPAAVVDAERARFEALCDSLKSRVSAEPQEPEPPKDKPAIEWSAPSEWRKLGSAPMRIVTFGAATRTECYISSLQGDAGGLAANVNRWRGLYGMPKLDDASIAALPKIKLLGQDVVLVQAAGDYQDMQGEKHPGYAMLGVMSKKGDQSIFVRMIGPAAEVDAERERFVAFVGSIR